MTVILKDIPKMNKQEATLVLNGMMTDFSKVRLQVSNTGDGATELMMHNEEVIDAVVELLFERINYPDKDILSNIKQLKIKATNADIKVYHALSYDDGNVEANLKASINDISDINSKFIKFVKDKQNGDDESFKKAKKLFFAQSESMKEKYDVTYEKDDHTLKLSQSIGIQKKKLNKLVTLVNNEETFINGKSKGMLPQILTVIAIATTTSKVFNFFRNWKKEKN